MMLANAITGDRQANFGGLRLGLVAGVIVSRARPIALGQGTAAPFMVLIENSLGGWAVGHLFFLSGLSAATTPVAIVSWHLRERPNTSWARALV